MTDTPLSTLPATPTAHQPSDWLGSLRARLLLALLALLTLSAMVTGLASYQHALHQSEAQFDYQLMQMALSLRDHGEVSDTRALTDERLDFVVQIWSSDGRMIYASNKHETLPNRIALGYADVQTPQQTWRTYSVVTPERIIQVAQPVAARQRMAGDAALQALQPVAWVALLLLGASWWLTGFMLQPLQLLTQKIQGREANFLDKLPEQNLPQELRPLVAALNGLLTRLQAAWATQRNFVTDAAHELRSPLTALKLQLHLLQPSPANAVTPFSTSNALGAATTPAQPEPNPELWHNMAESVARMSHLVEQLLLLARNEQAQPGEPTQRLDLAELSRQQLAEVAPLAHSRNATLTLDAPNPVQLQGQPLALGSLLRNLLDNALLHNPPGICVQVSVLGNSDNSGPVWVVDDSGTSIPASERERVFDRFYRSSAPDSPGSGLGLAIVRAIAQQHGAQVQLQDSPLGGLRVCVRWPSTA